MNCKFCNYPLILNDNPNGCWGRLETDTVNFCTTCRTTFIIGPNNQISLFMIVVNLNRKYKVYSVVSDNILMVYDDYKIVLDLNHLPEITPFNAKHKIKTYLLFS